MSWTRRSILPGRCVLAGLCIVASVPPWGWWPLAFVGIALLDRLIADQPWKRRLRRTWLVGAAWLFPALFWIWDLTAARLRGGRRPLRGATSRWPPPSAHRVGRRWLALPGLFLLAEVAPLDLPLRRRAARDPGHEPGRGPAGPDRPAAGLRTWWSCWWWPAASPCPPRGNGTGRWPAASSRCSSCSTALALVAPRGHDVGPLRIAIVQGGGPQHTRAADTDPREVFERHIEASKLVTQPVDLVLWPENVVAVEGRLSDNKENSELSAAGPAS